MITMENEAKISSKPEDRKKARDKTKKKKKWLLIIFMFAATLSLIQTCTVWVVKEEFKLPIIEITGLTTGSAIAEYDHPNLNLLNWSVAGHVIDTDFNMNGNNITRIGWMNALTGTIYSSSHIVSIGNMTASYFIGDGSHLYNVNYSVSTHEETINVNIVNGSGTGTSSLLNYEILQIIVEPTTSSNNYNFEAHETTSGNVIDRDRIDHTGDWNIRKNIPVSSDTITVNITSASIDEAFTVTVRYVK